MKTKKTLKNRINNFILKNEDICCEKEMDRKIIIEQIFALYEKIAEFYNEKDNYLDYIDNDIATLIGYEVDLKNNKDIKGLKLWKEISKITSKGNKLKIIKLLNDVPLYFLLSFLGLAYYKYKQLGDNSNL